jgi:hypothetical protein
MVIRESKWYFHGYSWVQMIVVIDVLYPRITGELNDQQYLIFW